MFDAILAVMDCSQVAVPEATEQAMRYYKSGNILWTVEQLWSLIVPLLFLAWGFTGKLSALSQKIGRYWFFTVVIYLVIFVALYQILNFPLDFYDDFLREHSYGLSTQTFERWIENYGMSVLLTVISVVVFVWIFYLLLKKSPKRWWFYSSLVSIGIMFIMMFLQPIWIDPLFNTFGPMKDKKLEQQILDLAARAGIEHGRVFEVDKSEDTKTLNAYVIGFGSTNRIVLWDTTIKQLKTDEILFVMGHEMGHYVLHHIWWSMLYFAIQSFVIFYLVYRSANYLLHKFKKRFGFAHLYDIASVPLLLFLMTFFLLLVSPIDNVISRYMEHEADRFGLEITQNNQAAAEAFIALQQENLAVPYPGMYNKIWQGTHPALGERIEFSNSYCPWRQGIKLKYGKHFRSEEKLVR